MKYIIGTFKIKCAVIDFSMSARFNTLKKFKVSFLHVFNHTPKELSSKV